MSSRAQLHLDSIGITKQTTWEVILGGLGQIQNYDLARYV